MVLLWKALREGCNVRARVSGECILVFMEFSDRPLAGFFIRASVLQLDNFFQKTNLGQGLVWGKCD